jgi:peroxiredoxin Q/BCP
VQTTFPRAPSSHNPTNRTITGTRQACHFRDSYTPLTATGFDIYGLSNDNPKSNTAFKTKQKLPYPLLCDTSRQLITAIGLKNAKNTTARGVFVVDKKGKVLAAETASPEASVEIVRKIINAGETTGATSSATEGTKETDVAVATTADEVANTAAKLDGDEV